MPVNDYSTTPGSNTTINGINIAENCPPDTLNNAIRQVMADIATWRAGTAPTVPFTGGGTLQGAYTFSGAVTFSVAPVFTDAAGSRTALGAAASGAATASGLTMATARILGRTTAGTGALQEISIGAGLSLAAGVLSNTGGSGTVTSVNASGGTTGFAFTGGPVTSSGTLTLTVSNAATARTAIEAAKSGANTDITALDQDVTITATGTIAADTLGYRGIPVVTTTGKTLELSDAGKDIYTSGNITIPANGSVAFPVGTVISITDSGGAARTISITTDTLRWNASTGTRTLAAYGTATIHKKTSTLWFIKGDVS